jgi:flagellar biosynthesis/type III secretory pathway chaperone
MADIALVLNQAEDDLTLTKLSGLLEGQSESKELSEIRDRFKTIMEELSEVNKQNDILIRNAMEYNDYAINIIRSSMGQAIPPQAGSGYDYYEPSSLIDAQN